MLVTELTPSAIPLKALRPPPIRPLASRRAAICVSSASMAAGALVATSKELAVGLAEIKGSKAMRVIKFAEETIVVVVES